MVEILWADDSATDTHITVALPAPVLGIVTVHGLQVAESGEPFPVQVTLEQNVSCTSVQVAAPVL